MTEPLDDEALLRVALRAAGHVHALRVPEQCVLLDLRSERYLLLDDVAADMWDAILAAPTVGAALDALELQYEVAREELARDLLALVRRLLDRQLVEVVAADE